MWHQVLNEGENEVLVNDNENIQFRMIIEHTASDKGFN